MLSTVRDKIIASVAGLVVAGGTLGGLAIASDDSAAATAPAATSAPPRTYSPIVTEDAAAVKPAPVHHKQHTYVVVSGDTLTGIAQDHHKPYSYVLNVNPQLASDPDWLLTGWKVALDHKGTDNVTTPTPRPVQPAPEPVQAAPEPVQQYTAPVQADPVQPAPDPAPAPEYVPSAPAEPAHTLPAYHAPSHHHYQNASSGGGGGSLSDVPGVPKSFAACVAERESSSLRNPAANGNAYGIIPDSGHDVSGMSISQQKQVFSQLYSQYGSSPWSPYDGC
jgi:LysM repeat protein